MKALTVRQPWASLIAAGVKTIETRTRRTHYRGPLAIHAGVNPAAVKAWRGPFVAARSNTTQDYMLLGFYPGEGGGPLHLPMGAVVATATLVDCVPMVDADEPMRDHHEAHERWVAVGTNVLTLSRRDGAGVASKSIHDQRPYGEFTPGRWAWLLEDVEQTSPVPAKGRLGLWDWEPTR